MQTKKIIGIALCAAMLSSVVAISASAYDTAGKSYGVMGSFNGWAEDVVMTESNGVYTATIEVDSVTKDMVDELKSDGVPTGKYGVQFKVRSVGSWDDSWAQYEKDQDRTFNSQTNCLIENYEIGKPLTFNVTFDTTKLDADKIAEGSEVDEADEYRFWGVTYEVVEPEPEELPFEMNFGVVGSHNNWGKDGSDVAMTDEDGDGVYEAEVTMPAGENAFKVRICDDTSWSYSWGMYEKDEDRTQNSQTDCKVTLDEETTVTVQLDTNGANYNLWPITYSYVDGNGETVLKYVGKPEEEEESSTESSEETSEVSKIEISESKIDDYIYFDNTDTKWEVVYCYYYAPEYGQVTDFAGRDISLPVDEAAGRVIWPGAKMEQVLDADGNPTDIWQYPAPIGATALFFNNGWSDPAVKEYFESLSADDQKKAKAEHGKSGFKCAYQTYEKGDGLAFNYDTDKGKVYAIKKDAVENDDFLTWNGGKFSLKASYSLEAMAEAKAYEGPFNKEVFSQKDIENAKKGDDKTVDPDNKNTNSGSNTSGNTSGNGTGVPATSDTAMAVAFVGVAVAALGAAVLASKKKRDEE